MTSPLPSELRPVRREFLEPSDRLERLGLHPSPVAFGLAGIGGAWGPVDPGLARETLRQAMELGVTVFDVAPSYGAAESLLGAALAGWPGPRPVISTKVGRLPGRDGHKPRLVQKEQVHLRHPERGEAPLQRGAQAR
jgi:aryl-alcohol dehydrogenase-like predicted oxidoreductase